MYASPIREFFFFLVNLESTIMAKTIVSIPTLGLESPAMGGTLTEQQVKTMFAPQAPGINAMVGTAVNSTDADGAVVTWTFAPRTGNKG